MTGNGATSPLLAVRGVKTAYGKIIALKGVDLEVNDGEISIHAIFKLEAA